MSFDTVTDSVVTVVQKLSEYSPSNSKKYDYSILRSGRDRVLVAQFGGTIEVRRIIAAPRRVNTAWLVNLELFVPYRGLNEIGRDMVTEVQRLIDHFDQYPTLNSATGVVTSFVINVSAPERYQNNTRWWMTLLQLRVDERANITIAE